MTVQEVEARPAKQQRGAKAAAQATMLQVAELEAGWDDELAEAAPAAGSDNDSPPAARQQPRPRQKKQRVLVDVHSGLAPYRGSAVAAGEGGAAEAALEDVDNEYERQRLERIRRNEQMLRQLGVAEAAGGLAAAVAAEQAPPPRRPPPRPRERRAPAPALPLPSRKSARQRGARPLTSDEAVAAAVAELGALEAAGAAAGAAEADPETAALLDQETYFQLIGRDISGAIVSDGRFRGWVSPAVCERYGIAGDPDAAWEAGGGGQFSFKIDKSAIPAALKGRGWSDARAFSHTQLRKNPNAYFYRHVAPHEQQAQGEWTEEEHRLFLETARAHGVGDKWGLFASHLPQRVGYQCSAYYRDVIIPQGLVLDRRYRMTRGGKAVFVG